MAYKNTYWKEREFVAELVNQLPAAIFWKNSKSIFMGCNQTFANLAGLSSPQDIIGKTDFDLPWGERYAHLYRDDDQEVIKNKQPKKQIEENQTLADGREIVLLTSKTPLFSKDGKVMGVLGIYHDITDRKKMEVSLKEAKESAEYANKAKDEFLANMSHDIRTPLTGIIGISALLEEEAEKPEEKEYAHWINVSGDQLLKLLNGVLDVVTVGNNQEFGIKQESVTVTQLLQNISELEQPTVKLKNLALIMHIEESVPHVIKTDAIKLHRILLNLLGNAIKFTDKGQVGISIRYQPSTEYTGQLECLVSDTGAGIAPENQGKVFERFYRGDLACKGQHAGYGVGLHIVQEYVAMLKGTISLSSTLGEGTVFTVSIPVEIVPMHKEICVPSYSPVDQSQPIFANANPLSSHYLPFFLLVEDNPIALKVVESIAKQAGCQYLSATTGEKAFELFKMNAFDLILSDIGLPGISGHELAVAIRQYEKNLGKKHVPIIGLTAHAASAAEYESLKAGMNKVISKPISLAIMNELLSDFLPKEQEKLNTPIVSISNEIPKNQSDLFNIDHFPLLDIATGIKTFGSIETLRELLDLMLNEEIPKHIEAIEQAYDKQNWIKIKQLAHNIKSSALYCGALRMQYACQYLECHQQLQDELYRQLMTVIAQTKVSIIDWLK